MTMQRGRVRAACVSAQPLWQSTGRVPKFCSEGMPGSARIVSRGQAGKVGLGSASFSFYARRVKEEYMFRSGLALLMILLAAPACAGSRFGGGFHGGALHGGFHGGGFHNGGFHGSGFHNGSAFAFHRGVGRTHALFGAEGFGYNCGLGFDCGVYDPGYGYGGGAGIGVNSSGGLSSSGGYSGGYVPDPEGAEIAPVIFPTPCWVRRAGYDPSGAYMGQVLIDLCRPSNGVTVTRVDARANTTGKGTAERAAMDRSGAPQSPRQATPLF